MSVAEPGVEVQQEGTVLHVTLNRPGTRNALTLADLAALHAALDLDPSVRAAVFAGAGPVFCSGMNVGVFLGFDQESATAFIADLRDLLRRVRTLPVVTLCAVDGHCLGAAFELAMACDLRVGTDRAFFGLPEIKVGIPSVIDAALLSQYVGLAMAKEMILTGDPFPVAALPGLCNTVVGPDALAGAVDGLLAKLTGHTRTVVAAQKRLFEVWQNMSLVDGADVSVAEFGAVFSAAETADQIAAYRARLGGGQGQQTG